MMSAIVTFLVSSVAIIAAGIGLARFGDNISKKSGIGLLFIGVIFVALGTSLPELATDVFAALQRNPNLAMGDILGSSLFNMMILALIDLLFLGIMKKKALPAISVLRRVTIEHSLAVSLAIGLTSLTALFIVLKLKIGIWLIGLPTLSIFVIYLAGMWLLFSTEKEKSPERIATNAGKPIWIDIGGFSIAAILILIAAPNLSSSAKALAQISGLGATFFGTLFLAFVTSFPELIVGIEAVRIGAFDLAVGNLFGSNALNMAILFPIDIALKGSLFILISPVHVVTALIAIILMVLALVGLILRSEKRIFFLVPDAYLMLAIFIAGMWTIYSIS